MNSLADYAPKSGSDHFQRPTSKRVESGAYKQFLNQTQRLGFDRAFVDMLMSTAMTHDNVDAYWLEFIENYLEVTDVQSNFEAYYRHIAIVGDIASGKSTLIAQLACHLAMKQPSDEIVFALCENTSGSVNELLVCLARIIGCPILYVRSAEELINELETLGRHRRFLIDLPSKPSEQLSYLKHIKSTEHKNPIGILCALAPRSEVLASKEAMRLWLKYSHGWALSFASEQRPIGVALSMASKSPRPLAYIAKSTDFLEGITPASSQHMKTLILSGITGLNRSPGMEMMVS